MYVLAMSRLPHVSDAFLQKIAWFKLQDLPTWKRNKPVSGKFYLITPFIGCVCCLSNVVILAEHTPAR